MPTPLGTYIHVRSLVVLPNYRLQLQFDDGSERVIDFEPLHLGPVWGALRDETLFAQVRVNVDTRTIEWPNGVDLNPMILHDWPEYSEKLIAERRARYVVETMHRE